MLHQFTEGYLPKSKGLQIRLQEPSYPLIPAASGIFDPSKFYLSEKLQASKKSVFAVADRD
tara:strand:+ start:3956 stop:4138 length:183 start_codon:yes stop_codon:yes gene_type:complete